MKKNLILFVSLVAVTLPIIFYSVKTCKPTQPVAQVTIVKEVVEEEVEELPSPTIAEEVIVVESKEPESTAEAVWLYLKTYELSDIVCAGIVGNLMRETGGDTFNLRVNADGCGYGLCQWLGGRRQNLFKRYGKNPTLEEQMDFMLAELTGNGIGQEVKKHEYDLIMNAETPEECAYYFAKHFERCANPGNKKTGKRERNARKAYEAFSGN